MSRPRHTITHPSGSEGATRFRGSLAAVAGAVSIVVLPLIADPWGFQSHVALRWLLLGLAVGVGAWSVRDRLWVGTPRRVLWGWGALLTTSTLSSLTALSPFHALIGESHRRAGLLSLGLAAGAFALGRAVRSDRTVVLRAAPVATGVVLLAVLATLGSQGLASPRAVLVGNAGQLGGYLVMLAGVNLAILTSDPDGRWRRAGLFGAVVALGLVTMTGSYAAIVGGVVLLALFWMLQRACRTGGTWWVWVVGGAAGLVSVALLWPAQFRALGPSIQGRLDTWAVSLEVVWSRPVLGWGLEGFRHGFALVVPESFVATWGDERVQDRAHSLLLDHAAATGIVGLVALGVLLVGVASAIRDRGSQQDRELGVVLLAAGAFLLGWFLEFDLAAVLALLAGLAVPSEMREGRAAIERALTVAVIVASAVVVVVGAVALVEDHRFGRAVDEVAEVATGEVPEEGGQRAGQPAADEVGDVGHLLGRALAPTSGYTELLVAVEFLPVATLEEIEAALATLDRVRAWRDPGRDAEVALARAELTLERARRVDAVPVAADAVATFDEVLDLSPHHSYAWRGLATARMLARDPAARDALLVLAALRPGDVGVRHDLAVLELQAGDLDAARRWVEEACLLAPGDDQLERLVVVLQQAGSGVLPCGGFRG